MEDLWRFMLRPTFTAQPMAWGRGAAMALLIVFLFALALDTLVAVLVGAWDDAAGFLPAPVGREAGLAEDLFQFLILAPVIEEFVFRGWLTGRVAALRYALYGLGAMGLFLAALWVGPDLEVVVALTGVALAFAGLIHWGLTRQQDSAVPAWFTRHFHWFVWGSTILFGLIHLGNHAPLEHPLGLLAVLPQTIGGLILAYTRTRIGLVAAIVQHAAYNAVFLAGEYIWW